jgi:Lrp/AsnC family transcriptional regulator, regulator for asnA, asnC and gidA
MEMARQKIDKIDITILRNLQRDARTKYSDIAKQSQVSVDTIIKRYRRLQKRGIITKTTLLLDPRRFGDEVIANFNIDVEPQSVTEVITFLEKQPNVKFSTHAMGEDDIFTIATARNMNEMNNLKEKIQSHNMVREVKTSIWVDQFLLCPQNFELEPLMEKKR